MVRGVREDVKKYRDHGQCHGIDLNLIWIQTLQKGS